MRLRRQSLVILGLMLVAAPQFGCVAKSAFDDVSSERDQLRRERDRLNGQLERVTLERNSLEDQFVEAQESFEDERVVRESLASNLAQLEQRATVLDRDLDQERDAHLRAATALAAREAEIAALQSTYDGLVTDLESEVSAGQIEIERLREGLRLNVSDEVLFASGSARLDSIGRDVLVKVAKQLVSLEDYIEVRGHTDNIRIRGSLANRFPTNWELAAARAARVVRLLESQGVPGDRLAVVSLGPNEPVAPNDSASNRALNRRIEIRLLPKEGSIKAPPKPASAAGAVAPAPGNTPAGASAPAPTS